jgi:hypothetical protein
MYFDRNSFNSSVIHKDLFVSGIQVAEETGTGSELGS